MYELNANGYIYNAQTYIEEFQHLLCGIVSCYNIMVNNNVKLVNKENKIRDILLRDYLNNDDIRLSTGLREFSFNREVPEDMTEGRTDIKIEVKNQYRQVAAYYTIECKRLDNENQKGISGLNAKYIKDGIKRFVSNYYSTYCRINGMIGFVVKETDIPANTEYINVLMKTTIECNLTREMQKENFIPGFEYHYSSFHNNCKNKEFTLYHLMLDFSKNIEDTPHA
jgi:hypothetical protein